MVGNSPPNSSTIPRTILPNLHISPNLRFNVHAVFCLALTVCIRFFQTKPAKGRLIGVDMNGEERNSVSGQYARTSSPESFSRFSSLRALCSDPAQADSPVVCEDLFTILALYANLRDILGEWTFPSAICTLARISLISENA